MRFLASATLALLALTGTAHAGIPLVNATCPGGIEVHADEGGPIYLNGQEASLKKFNENYFEAKNGAVTVSLSIRPDGSPDVSYTGPGRANGVCALAGNSGGASSGAQDDGGACPVDVSQADRYKYPACDSPGQMAPAGKHGHHHKGGAGACPPDVSQADRYKYPGCN